MLTKSFFSIVLISVVASELYSLNDIILEYQDDAQIIYLPEFENYPDILPDYRDFTYPQKSFSHQMWNGCGCATAKTYGDYMKMRPRSRDQRLSFYYQMM